MKFLFFSRISFNFKTITFAMDKFSKKLYCLVEACAKLV
jgi:hypothetical protein